MKPAFVLTRSPSTFVRAFDLTVGRETVKAELHDQGPGPLDHNTEVIWFDDAGTWRIYLGGPGCAAAAK